EGRGRDLRLALGERLLAADLVLEATELAGRVEHVDRTDGVLHLGLRLGDLGACQQLAALGLELAELVLHAVQAALELVDDLGLRGDLRLGGAGLALGADLTLQGDLGKAVELVGIRGVARAAQLIGRAAGGARLVAPLAGGADVLLVVALEQTQVADGLGDRRLGIRDVVRVVADELIDHLLRVLGLVEERVDVRADERGDASEDGFLGHGVIPFLLGWLSVVIESREGHRSEAAAASAAAAAEAAESADGDAASAAASDEAAASAAAAAAQDAAAEAAFAAAPAGDRADDDAAEQGSQRRVAAPSAAGPA